jgi:hypothetical protein
LNKLENLVIANLKHRMFIWTPPKTGSTSAMDILKNLGFNSYFNNSGYFIPHKNDPQHNHFCKLCNSHGNYSFITTLRNPYTIMSSYFLQTSKDFDSANTKNFEDYLNFYFYDDKHLEVKYFSCYNYSKRLPDYIIRLENMFDDYVKLPFVLGTDYYKSGQLKKDCTVKKNPSQFPDFDWKSLYNQPLADIVYYNFAHVFELGGYDKDSWKK